MRSASHIAAWLAFAAVSAVTLAQPAVSNSSAYGYDLHGQPVEQLAAQGTQAVVLFFVATDCPVSNRYMPEIERLEKEFSARHVAFWVVYPNATETVDGVIHHRTEYGLDGATFLRPSRRLLATVRPTLTPEAAVLVAQSAKDAWSAGEGFKVAYAGRIDDRYVRIGLERPRATRHDLEDAITAVLNHGQVEAPGGPPVGCGIISEAALHSGVAKP